MTRTESVTQTNILNERITNRCTVSTFYFNLKQTYTGIFIPLSLDVGSQTKYTLGAEAYPLRALGREGRALAEVSEREGGRSPAGRAQGGGFEPVLAAEPPRRGSLGSGTLGWGVGCENPT